MAFREKFHNLIFSSGLTEEEYQAILPQIRHANYQLWRFVPIIMVCIYLPLLIASLLVPSISANRNTYLIMLVISVALLLSLTFTTKENSNHLKYLIFLTLFVNHLFAMYIGIALSPELPIVSFLPLLLCSSLVVLSRPVWMYVYIFVICLMACLACLFLKPASIASLDIVDIVSVGALSIIFHTFITNVRLSDINSKRITEQLRANEAKINSEEQLKNRQQISMLASLSSDFTDILCVDLTTNEVLSYSSAKLIQGTNFTAYDQILSYFTEHVVNAQDSEYIRKQLDRHRLLHTLLASPSQLYSFRANYQDNVRHYEVKITLDMSSTDHIRMIAAFHDINQRVKLEETYSQMLRDAQLKAITDPLTGIGNRNVYLQMAERLDLEITSFRQPKFAIAMFDVNLLKQTNDIYGHDAGDALLIRASELISRYFGKENTFRMGGDEFASILVDDLYDRRDELLASLDNSVRKNEDNVSLASGMAVYDPAADTSVADVLKRSDQIMYENKRRMKELDPNLKR